MKITDEAVNAAVEALRDRQIQPPLGRHLVHIVRAALEAALPHLEGATPQFDEATYRRVHNFMRGWDRGEVISASITDRERQATLTYADLGALLDAYKREGATPVAHDQLAAEVEPWLRECGSCDAGLPMACTCPPGDYRNILLKVWRAYELREGATPAIDREAVLQALKFPGGGCSCERHCRETQRHREHLADALLALIGGAR